jgi:spore coat protein A
LLQSDSFELMQFRVGLRQVGSKRVAGELRAVPRIRNQAAVRTRRLTLDESAELVAESTGMLLNNTPWHMPITEKPVLGDDRDLGIVNLTDDVHPIHLHMVKFQILDRRKFDAFQYMTAGRCATWAAAGP